jgi:hypothetical protein
MDLLTPLFVSRKVLSPREKKYSVLTNMLTIYSCMTYYILLSQDSEQDSYYHANQLGESSFKKFYCDDGYQVLIKLIQNYPDKLSEVQIIDSAKHHYTIEEFLDEIKELELIV